MITIYGQEGCFYCRLARDFLDAKELKYTYINVRIDTEAMKLFRENNFKDVPQIYVDNEHIGGYTELRKYMRDK